MAWRFLILDSTTFQPQAEIAAIESARFSDVLNNPGSFEVSAPLVQPPGSSLSAAMLLPPRSIFAVERDEVIIHAGFVWTHEYNLAEGTLRFSGEGVQSVLRRRVLRQTLNYTGIFQESIAWDLIQLSQNAFRGNLNITDRSVNSVARTRTYYYYERKFIGTLIEQLAAVDGGFDFRFTPGWTSGPNSTIGWWFDTRYPATGRRTDVVLELGANADIPSVSLDGTNLAYIVDALGQGQGETMPISTQANMPGLTAGILLDDTVTKGDVIVQSTLTAYAKQRLNRGSAAIVIPKVDVDTSLLGTIALGDQVTVTAAYGLLQLSDLYRITQIDVDIPADGPEKATLSLAPLGVFSS